MKFSFRSVPKAPFFVDVRDDEWSDWEWQMRHGLKTEQDFSHLFPLSPDEVQAFTQGGVLFNIRATPYYMSLVGSHPQDPVRIMAVPRQLETEAGAQAQWDPLGERKNSPAPRIIHRYPDRVLFLITDICSVYCRYCTRKHFTGHGQAFPSKYEYKFALQYIRSHPGVREVILSGGDPLTLSDDQLFRVLKDLRDIEHIEIIRIGTRMPVVCPMRVTPQLVDGIRKWGPIYVMTHFNHPKEVTAEAKIALDLLANGGMPLFNQMVLLRGVNNHPVIVQALSRRLMYLRVKPYYMFQCDPSQGTDHLRTDLEESEQIQRELWGNLSGLAMPQLSVDIPSGGGKAPLFPNFELNKTADGRIYRGFDGVEEEYRNPIRSKDSKENQLPVDASEYLSEWENLKEAKETAIV